MVGAITYDITFLGIKDPSPGGRSRLIHTMERLTGRTAAECQQRYSKIGAPIFGNIPADQARLIVGALDEAGVLFEVRPKSAVDYTDPDDQPADGMVACPSCHFVQRGSSDECSRCGVVFSKVDRVEVRRMQNNQALEEAQARADQIRQEWDERARQFTEKRPLPKEKIDAFAKSLSQEEIPFLLLRCSEGQILMTSRQMIANFDNAFVHLPYEIIKDVDYGGGLVVKKDHTRLQVTFHSQIPVKEKNLSSISWQLDAEAATYKETIMDWAFARSYMCGACGARELDFRTKNGRIRGRCMHCATDHEIDLRHHRITPMISS